MMQFLKSLTCLLTNIQTNAIVGSWLTRSVHLSSHAGLTCISLSFHEDGLIMAITTVEKEVGVKALVSTVLCS